MVPSTTTGYIQYINYNAVALPATKNADGAYQPPFGNMSRNPGRTPALYQTDLDFNKQFNLPREGMQIEFRSELYNIFNHSNLYLPSTISGTQGANALDWRPHQQHLHPAHDPVRVESCLLIRADE